MNAAHILVMDVQLKLGQQGEHLFLHGADMLPAGIQNVEAVTPGELALHGIDGSAVLVINIVAVKPRKQALLE